MICHHCGMPLASGLDTIFIVRPTSMQWTHETKHETYYDLNNKHYQGNLPPLTRVELETYDHMMLGFCFSCWEKVAGKEYVPG